MYELTIRGHRYLYFWRYETKAGFRKQIKEYMGPATSPEARSRAVQRCDAYYARMRQELRRLREATLSYLAPPRSRVRVVQP